VDGFALIGGVLTCSERGNISYAARGKALAGPLLLRPLTVQQELQEGGLALFHSKEEWGGPCGGVHGIGVCGAAQELLNCGCRPLLHLCQQDCTGARRKRGLAVVNLGRTLWLLGRQQFPPRKVDVKRQADLSRRA
jgi:hypothetical protein